MSGACLGFLPSTVWLLKRRQEKTTGGTLKTPITKRKKKQQPRRQKLQQGRSRGAETRCWRPGKGKSQRTGFEKGFHKRWREESCGKSLWKGTYVGPHPAISKRFAAWQQLFCPISPDQQVLQGLIFQYLGAWVIGKHFFWLQSRDLALSKMTPKPRTPKK